MYFEGRPIHNGCHTRLYHIWQGMKERCNNPNSGKAKWYLDKGIKVCEEWQKFQGFRDWANQNGYRDDLTIDRINPDGDYCADNCRWISIKEQSRNRSSNVFINYKGEAKTLAEWSEILKIDYKVLHNRVSILGWDIDKSFETPVKHVPHEVVISLNGEAHTIGEWSKILGISKSTIDGRYRKGWSPEDCLKPIDKRFSHSKAVMR